MAFTSFKDNLIIQRIFQGVRPVAVALILIPAVNMAKKGNKRWWTWLLMFGTAFLVAFLKVSAIWILICVISISTIIMVEKERRHKDKC